MYYFSINSKYSGTSSTPLFPYLPSSPSYSFRVTIPQLHLFLPRILPDPLTLSPSLFYATLHLLNADYSILSNAFPFLPHLSPHRCTDKVCPFKSLHLAEGFAEHRMYVAASAPFQIQRLSHG